MPAGYSGKPLYQKLGMVPGTTVCVINAPVDYEHRLEGISPDVKFSTSARGRFDIAHVFVVRRAELSRRLPGLVKAVAPDGAVWVSWPKKSAGVPTDLTEDVIRELAFPLDLVDVKVCAIDDTWSGLKLVIRKDRRALFKR